MLEMSMIARVRVESSSSLDLASSPGAHRSRRLSRNHPAKLNTLQRLLLPVKLYRLLGEIIGKEPDKVKLCMNNKPAIALCKNPVFHDRIKHIDTRYHYIRQCMEEGKIEVIHVSTNNQLDDILTKALARAKFVEMRQRLGIMEVKSSHQD
jgi:hypothetical protein